MPDWLRIVLIGTAVWTGVVLVSWGVYGWESWRLRREGEYVEIIERRIVHAERQGRQAVMEGIA